MQLLFCFFNVFHRFSLFVCLLWDYLMFQERWCVFVMFWLITWILCFPVFKFSSSSSWKTPKHITSKTHNQPEDIPEKTKLDFFVLFCFWTINQKQNSIQISHRKQKKNSIYEYFILQVKKTFVFHCFLSPKIIIIFVFVFPFFSFNRNHQSFFIHDTHLWISIEWIG